MSRRGNVVVVGAGAVGLTCAIRLADAGFVVRIIARELPPETTSAIAAAIWYPYLALPQDRVTAWGKTSYETFAQLASAAPESGVRLLPGSEFFTEPQSDPWWLDAVPRLRRLRGADLRGTYADGWTFVAPVIDMPVYLDWLVAAATARGITIERRALAATDVSGPSALDADLLVLCVGLGAADLLGDDAMQPVRGQVVVVENPGIDAWALVDAPDGTVTYVVPRHDTVILGGTSDADRTDCTPDPAVAAEIRRRAAQLVPAVATAAVVADRVGLRPARTTVRVEPSQDGRTIYCYGHGGAGVTLSWGCADDVVRLASAAGLSTGPGSRLG